MIWRSIALIMIMAIGLGWASPDAHAAKKKNRNQPNDKYASLIMDSDTGAILSSRFADSPRQPASLTKMMTLLLTFDALERGDIKLRDRLHISPKAAGASPSKLGLAAGSSIRVEDAILALVTKSANDIAIAMSEYLGTTESNFALMMTRRARDIGMTQTTFRNASGLPVSGQFTTARDMAKLARFILNRYPHYYGYFSTRTFTYQGKTYRNHNHLMETYAGMDGFKTGYINASGFNLVASARRNGHRLIGVVFGGRSTASRNDHMATLLDAGFRMVGKMPPGTQVAMIDGTAPLKPAPLPARKPGMLVAQDIMKPAAAPVAAPTIQVASLAPTPAADDPIERQLVKIQPVLQSGEYDELAGQGDVDPAVTARLETGLLASAVYKDSLNPQPVNVALSPAPAAPADNWAVQIGAFNSRVATDDALRRAVQSLPAALKDARPLVVPLRTGNNLMFRARLAGFNRDDAKAACLYLRDCMTIAPRAE